MNRPVILCPSPSKTPSNVISHARPIGSQLTSPPQTEERSTSFVSLTVFPAHDSPPLTIAARSIRSSAVEIFHGSVSVPLPFKDAVSAVPELPPRSEMFFGIGASLLSGTTTTSSPSETGPGSAEATPSSSPKNSIFGSHSLIINGSPVSGSESFFGSAPGLSPFSAFFATISFPAEASAAPTETAPAGIRPTIITRAIAHAVSLLNLDISLPPYSASTFGYARARANVYLFFHMNFNISDR